MMSEAGIFGNAQFQRFRTKRAQTQSLTDLYTFDSNKPQYRFFSMHNGALPNFYFIQLLRHYLRLQKMRYANSASSRVLISEKPDVTGITIYPKRYFFSLIFLPFWLWGWTYAGISVSSILKEIPEKNISFSLLLYNTVWACGWMLGMFFATTALLWQFFGRETLDLSSTKVTKKKTAIFSIDHQIFDPKLIKNPRPTAEYYKRKYEDTKVLNEILPTWFGGDVVFDYGERTIFFGGNLEEAEANLIADTISRRLSLMTRLSS